MTTAASIPAGKVATIDPATGIELAAYPETSDDQVEAILERAYRAGAAWREVPVTERAETVRRLGRALRERSGELARLATAEMGKPLAQSQAEVEKCAAACEWFAEHGPGLLAPETVATEARLSQVRYEPLGVLFAIGAAIPTLRHWDLLPQQTRWLGALPMLSVSLMLSVALIAAIFVRP